MALGIVVSLMIGMTAYLNHLPITDDYQIEAFPENLGGGILHNDIPDGEDED